MSSEDEKERKKKEEFIARERQADEERREKAGLESPELKKFDPSKDDSPQIDQAASTHQAAQPRITDSAASHQSQQPKKPSKFDTIKERFSESGDRLRENFERGARRTAEDTKDALSKKAREKLGRQTTEEAAAELKKMKDRLALIRTQRQYQDVKRKIKAANAADNASVFASNEGEFFGMNMGGLNPEQFFGFGVNSSSQPDTGFGGGGLDMSAWSKMFNDFGNSKKTSSPADYNILSLGGSGKSKNILPKWDGNILHMGGSGKKSKGLSLDDVKQFYGFG